MSSISNSWYRLATINGAGAASENARDWNIYITSLLDDDGVKNVLSERKIATDVAQIRSASAIISSKFKAKYSKSPPDASYGINFSGIEFDDSLDMSEFIFPISTNFSDSKFKKKANFTNSTFLNNVKFRHVQFESPADFESAIFQNLVTFENSTFEKSAHFRSTKFKGRVEFINSTFKSTAVFNNSKFEGGASFNASTFEDSPPQLYGATLHENTSWLGVSWPKAKSKEHASDFIPAYGLLKKTSENLKRHEEELDFFALELDSTSIAHEGGKRAPYVLYKLLSDYGRSYSRPIYTVLLSILMGWIASVVDYMMNIWDGIVPKMGVGRLFLLNIANNFSIFGFRKEFFEANEIITMSAFLQIIFSIQTLVGGIAVFLLGLAARNHFRMK